MFDVDHRQSYSYKPGMRFSPHRDGAFHRDDNEQSCYSFLVYPNEDFEGGTENT